MNVFSTQCALPPEQHRRVSRHTWPARLTFVLIGLVFFARPTFAQTEQNSVAAAALKKMSLEQLMDLEVTSVSRRAEKLSETASAIQVVSGEDIHRSGATSLPEALRLAPNLQVAQVNSSDWAISARGFNNTLANKLLVMIDGRTVYTPLYAGVFWDVQNVLLEDLDRIEVVSGPGGTLWGANAVNGVINVISKSARDTQGGLVTGGGGTLLQDFGAVRYGDNVGSNFFFRVYGQRFDRNSTVFPNGNKAGNDWDMTQGGFRTDWYPSEANTLTVQGDAYSGNIERPAPGSRTVNGQNVLGRWTHTFSEESDLSVQMYFDRTWRNIPNSATGANLPNQFAEDLRTYDLDLQHRFPIGERHSLIWGAGYRLMQDEVRNSPALAFLPADEDMQLFSGFLQDEITFIPERLQFTIGTKVEHNDFSGFEIQPSARLAWTPAEQHTVWGAVSRAVRSPSRIDTDLFAPGTPPFTVTGDPDFESEELIAYELGYRVSPTDKVTLSLATFYNEYDDLRSLNQVITPTATNQIIANDFEGETYGVELSGSWQATDWWRLRGGYTYLHKDLRPTSPMANPSVREGNDPQNQFLLQSIVDLPAHFQFDAVGRYVDTLGNPNVPSYFTFDVRVAWQYKDRLEISLVGQNLWDNQHPEFGAAVSRQEIPRSIYGKVTWRF